MMREHLIESVAALLAVLACVAQAAQPSSATAPADASPFVRLYDTGTASAAPRTSEQMADRAGWKIVGESDAKHEFSGDAVITNGQTAVVVRKDAPTADVYAGGAVMKLRAVLVVSQSVQSPLPGLTRLSCKIVENSSSAVALEASTKCENNDPVSVRLRLAAGAFFLEVRSVTNAGSLLVAQNARYVVVPDFFGDDLVYDGDAAEGHLVPLPSDSSLLGLADDGQAIVACVWSSPQQLTHLLGPTEPLAPLGRKASLQIDLGAGRSVWLAVFEGKDIWHAREIATTHPGQPVALDWKPPFAAKWRASLAASDASARSWNFVEGADGGARPSKPDDCVCWFDAGRAMVKLPDSAMQGAALVTEPAGPRTMVVYPIDRSRATPLTNYCLTDLMRDTLGVGPCQYVLDAEGFCQEGQKGSAQAATPDQVTRWVEKQFEKKASRREGDVIKERLAAMVQQVKAAQARIEQYHQCAQRVREICQSAQAADKTGLARQMLAIAAGMQPPPAATDHAPAPQVIEALAAQISAAADKDDAPEKCRDVFSTIRSAGVRQDYDLARLRMAMRRLDVLCSTTPASSPAPGTSQSSPGPDADPLATRVRKEIQKLAPKKPAVSQPSLRP